MIFVSTLYDVRSRMQGIERVERKQDRQCKYKHNIEAAMERQLNLGFIYVFSRLHRERQPTIDRLRQYETTRSQPQVKRKAAALHLGRYEIHLSQIRKK